MWDIRPAHMDRDHQLMIDAIVKYLNPDADEARFNWLYFGNPHGAGLAWIARDPVTQDFVGMASAFPRCVYYEGKEQVGWVLGEFCVHERFRMLGPALALQRTILGEMCANKIKMFYDFPSVGMMAIYGRLSIQASHRMVRMACPLRVDQWLFDRLKPSWIADCISPVANAALKMRHRPGTSSPRLSILPFMGPCGAEFTELAEETRWRFGNVVKRSAAYLDWRYFHNPQRRSDMLIARVHGRLIAYAVFGQDGPHGYLLDLFGFGEPAAIVQLVKRAATILLERGASTLSVAILDSHPMVPILRRYGFYEREYSPAVICEVGMDLKQGNKPPGRWCLMHGDRDS